jgi:arylsulfatase A-like enzyme
MLVSVSLYGVSLMRTLIKMAAFALAPLFAILVNARLAMGQEKPAARPNIVWIFVDDMSANFSCYGERTVQTPHVDRLAAEGIRFSRAFVTCPVCSPCRSALITGMFQTSIGAHHHRSGRGVEKIHLPSGVEPVPALFQKAGYYTCIGDPRARGGALGKTDYNFEWDKAIYDGTDWSGRKPGQPFFMQVQLPGGKLRGGAAFRQRVQKELGGVTRPEDVVLPPYYPRDPVILQDWADYLDACRMTDKQAGDVVQRLKDEGLLDQTYVFFMTDHGISHARGKQFLYDEGIHVPLVIRGPGIEKSLVRDDLVQQIDLAATSLALAGIEIPSWMQGKNILAKDYQKRDAVFSARDRCDETVEHLRSVRTERYKYIRNYLHERPHLAPNRYKDAKAIVRRLRELHAAGQLSDLQQKLLLSPTRPPEELYDLAADPHELKNLAGDPAHGKLLAKMRQRLARWEEETNDLGRQPEPATMYDSDMAVYLGSKSAVQDEVLKKNIALMKQWAREAK